MQQVAVFRLTPVRRLWVFWGARNQGRCPAEIAGGTLPLMGFPRTSQRAGAGVGLQSKKSPGCW